MTNWSEILLNCYWKLYIAGWNTHEKKKFVCIFNAAKVFPTVNTHISVFSHKNGYGNFRANFSDII